MKYPQRKVIERTAFPRLRGGYWILKLECGHSIRRMSSTGGASCQYVKCTACPQKEER